jgi:hypothetical protein
MAIPHRSRAVTEGNEGIAPLAERAMEALRAAGTALVSSEGPPSARSRGIRSRPPS